MDLDSLDRLEALAGAPAEPAEGSSVVVIDDEQSDLRQGAGAAATSAAFDMADVDRLVQLGRRRQPPEPRPAAAHRSEDAMRHAREANAAKKKQAEEAIAAAEKEALRGRSAEGVCDGTRHRQSLGLAACET